MDWIWEKGGERGIKDDSEDFGLRNWIDGVAFYWDQKNFVQKEIRSSILSELRAVKLEMSIWHLYEDAE